VARFGWHTLAGVWPEAQARHLPELAETAFRKGTGNGVVPELIEKAHGGSWKKNPAKFSQRNGALPQIRRSLRPADNRASKLRGVGKGI
jgi:hypothetical protein